MKRVVIKIGTALLTNKDFTLNKKLIKEISEQINNLKKSNFEVILVSSGAVASGRSEIKIKKENKNIPFRQVLSAVGQSILMKNYIEFFKKKKITVAQALLTNYDFTHKENFIVTANTIELLLKLGVIPIINENDVTTNAELKFGDNDILAAKVAAMISADTLVLLTDVDGLYTDDPNINKNAKLINEIKKIDNNVRKLAKKSQSKHALGGMMSKIDSAEYAVNEGIKCVVANGNAENVLINLLIKNKKIGTHFIPKIDKKEVKKRWMQASVKKGCKIYIDDGAKNAIKTRGASLLPSGIKEVKGDFKKGDVISVYALNKILLAYGITNYGSSDIKQIKGKHSKDILKILGDDAYEEVIHRDHLVIM